MPIYLYKGRNRSGEHHEGEIDALNEDAAATLLLEKGVIVTRLQDASTVLTPKEVLQQAIGFGRPKLEDLLIFARQMFTMMKAGVPIIRAIQVISESTHNKNLRETLLDLAKKIEEGKSLAAAMQEYPLIFPSLIVSMVHVGESTGNLEEAFSQIAIYVENEMDTQRRVKSAMRYPIFVLVAIVVAITVINIFVIPAFSKFFEKFGGDLPLPTRILMGSSEFMVNYWPILLLGSIGIVVGFLYYIRSDAGEVRWGKLVLKMPIIGSILEQALLARFCRSFAMTLKAGVPLLQALMVVSRSVDNAYVSQQVLGMRARLERGESLTKAAISSGMFTPLVLQMLKIGEETGNIEEMLEQVAQSYESEVDYALRGLSEAIEPILISVIAVIVLILALGIFLPMWELSQVAMKGG